MKVKIIAKQFSEIKEGSGVYKLDTQRELQQQDAISCVLEILTRKISDEEKARIILLCLVGKERSQNEI